jgi:hypothetical protein
VKDLWSIGSIRGCFCRGLRELERDTLQKSKGAAWAQRNGSGLKPALHEELKLKSREKPSLGFFFYQLFTVGGFVGGDYFFGQFIGDYVVVGKFHGVAGAGLRHGREVGGVGEHFG